MTYTSPIRLVLVFTALALLLSVKSLGQIQTNETTTTDLPAFGEKGYGEIIERNIDITEYCQLYPASETCMRHWRVLIPTKKKADIFTFRKSWQDPPLRTNKEVLKSPLFWIGEAASYSALIVAVKNPRSGENAGQEIPARLAVSGLGYIADRYFCECFTLAMDVYSTVHYAHSATK